MNGVAYVRSWFQKPDRRRREDLCRRIGALADRLNAEAEAHESVTARVDGRVHVQPRLLECLRDGGGTLDQYAFETQAFAYATGECELRLVHASSFDSAGHLVLPRGAVAYLADVINEGLPFGRVFVLPGKENAPFLAQVADHFNESSVEIAYGQHVRDGGAIVRAVKRQVSLPGDLEPWLNDSLVSWLLNSGKRRVVLVCKNTAGVTMRIRRAAELRSLSQPILFRFAQQQIASIGGLSTTGGLRVPHHTISAGGMMGATLGGIRRPGEFALSHAGFLYLEDVAAFHNEAIDLPSHETWGTMQVEPFRVVATCSEIEREDRIENAARRLDAGIYRWTGDLDNSRDACTPQPDIPVPSFEGYAPEKPF